MASSRRTLQQRTGRENPGARYYDDTEPVIIGNTVRQSAQPQWAPVEAPVPAPKRPAEHPKRNSKKRQQSRALLHAKAFNLPSLLVIGICMAAAVFSILNYVGQKNELDDHIRNVRSLTSQYQNDKQLNDAHLLEIESSISYTDIYEYAINELGMTFPGKDQVLWYKTTESEYVSQYEAIPQK